MFDRQEAPHAADFRPVILTGSSEPESSAGMMQISAERQNTWSSCVFFIVLCYKNTETFGKKRLARNKSLKLFHI